MAGIGDSWGTADEILHPRDSHGRWRSKWKMAASAVTKVLAALGPFSPRTFQSDAQATQYTQNLAHRNPGRFQGGRGYARLIQDFHNANNDLLDGNPDEPSTKKFVQMMDESMIETPDDVIVGQVTGPDAFGLTPDRIAELEDFTNTVVANRGYSAVNMGTPIGGGQGQITMSIALPKGNKVAVPGTHPGDRSIFLDRDQELTITKVKPDGRGGYYVWAVATPKTAGENPGPVGGHAGPGHTGDREADVRDLENAQMRRFMGEQGESQLPGGQAAGGLPEDANGRVIRPGAAPPTNPATERATRRAAILGRPAAPQEEQAPAAPAGAPTAQAPPAGVPQAGAPSAPAAPAAPATTPNVPAAVTPAPPSPEAVPTPSPSAPNAPGASTVEGGFRTAVTNAGLESPAQGQRRREWNSAYMGVTSGKTHPADALRDLEADIKKNKAELASDTGHGDSHLGPDIDKQERLADLIASHFNLGQRPSSQDRKAIEAEGEKARAAKSAERKMPTAKPEAPEKRKARQEKETAQLEQDRTDDELNATQRKDWAKAAGTPEPASVKKSGADIVLDEQADLMRNGRTTREKAATRIRDWANDQFPGQENSPEASYLRKVADSIEADQTPLPKRVPLRKKGPPKPPADVDAAEAKLAGRTEKNIQTGLSGLSVGELRSLAEKWEVNPRGEDKKLKLKGDLTKELAAKWKATPSLQRKAEGAPEAGPVDELDNLTVDGLKKYAKDNGIKVTGALRKDALKEAIKRQRDRTEPEAPVEEAPPVKKAAKVAKKIAPVPGEVVAAEQPAIPAKKVAKVALKKVAKAAPAAPATPVAEQVSAPAAKKLAKIADTPEMPAVIKKAATKAAKAADVSGRAAPGTAAGKLTASRLMREDKVLVSTSPGGELVPAKVKRDARPLTITSVSYGEGGRRTIKGHFGDGKEVTLKSVTPSQTFHVVEGEGTPGAPETPTAPAAPDGFKAEQAARRAAREVTPPVAPATSEAKVPGIDTAEREKLRARAREVLADIKARENEEKAFKQLQSTERGRELLGHVDRLRKEMEETQGPEGVSVDDRVAAHILGRMTPEQRASVLAEMPEENRKAAIEVAEKVAAAQKRVKAGGPDIDRMLSDAGIPKPASDSQDGLDYQSVKTHLDQGDVKGAQAKVKQLLSASDANLKTYRESLDAPGQTQANKEFLGRRITEELSRSQWLSSVGRTLSGGSDGSPELVTKKEIKAIPADIKGTIPELRQAAKAQGVKLPPGRISRDDILTEIAREQIRRTRAGQPAFEANPEAAVKVAKKAAPKVEHKPITARELTTGPQGEWSSGDEKMLSAIQQMLDGDPATLKAYGLPAGATPAAIGRYLDNWTGGAGGPGAASAFHTIPLDGARQRLNEAVKRGEPQDRIQRLRESLDSLESEQLGLQLQTARWRALAEKLKKTRRVPVKKAAPSTPKQKRVSVKAQRLHEQWQTTQKLLPDGTREPKLKSTKDKDWIAAHGTDQVDIANTKYPDLPADWQQENRDAGEVVDNIVERAGGKINLNDPEVYDRVGAEVHSEWLKRHGQDEGVKGGPLDKPFAELTPEEKKKDIDQVRIALGQKIPDKSPAPVKQVLARAAKSVPSPPPVAAVKKAAKKAAPSLDEAVEARRVRAEVSAEVAKKATPAVAKKAPAGKASTGFTAAQRQEFVTLNPSEQGDYLRARAGGLKHADAMTAARPNAPAAPQAPAPPPAAPAKKAVKKAAKAAVPPAVEAERENATKERDAGELLEAGRKAAAAGNKEEGDALLRQAIEKQMAENAARKAAGPPPLKAGEKKYTADELQEMNLGQIKDIEDDRGIKRTSVARDDRIAAILAHQAEAAPAKKAATKAPAKAAPAAEAPVKAVKKAAAKKATAPAPERAQALVDKLAAKKTAPAKKAPAVKAGVIKAGVYSDKEPKKNNWGRFGEGEIGFHADGVIGRRLRMMGQDDRLDVGGEPLRDVLGKIATDTVRGRTTGDQQVEQLKALHARLPEGTKAKSEVGDMVRALTVHKREAKIPEGTPDFLAKALRELSENPLARSPGRNDRKSELQELEEIAQQLKDGNPEVGSLLRLKQKITSLTNHRHESEEGKIALDAILTRAVSHLDDLSRNPARKAEKEKFRADLAERVAKGSPPKASGGGREHAYAQAREEVERLSKEKSSPTLSRKLSATTDELGFEDGRKVVFKAPGRIFGGDAPERVDAETLAPQLHTALGLIAPAIVPHKGDQSKHEPDGVYMQHMPGKTGREVSGGDAFASDPPKEIYNSDDGVLLGLADVISHHTDRHQLNWLYSDGRIHPIDNEDSFHFDYDRSDKLLEEAVRLGVKRGNFSQHFVGTDGFIRATNDLSPQDVAVIRQRLEALRPKFKASGREHWFEQMMERFEQVAAGAKGTKRRVK